MQTDNPYEPPQSEIIEIENDRVTETSLSKPTLVLILIIVVFILALIILIVPAIQTA